MFFLPPDERSYVVFERRNAGGTCSCDAVDERLGDAVDNLVGCRAKKQSWRTHIEEITWGEIHGKSVTWRSVIGERGFF